MTEDEVIQKATEEIIELRNRGMLEVDLVELTLMSMATDLSILFCENQMATLDRALGNLPEDNWLEDR